MDFNWVWVWVALSVILGLAEILTAGFFMLPFSIGAAVAALLQWLMPGSITWQWVAFIGISVMLLIVLRRFAERVTHDAPQNVAGNRLLGKTGVVMIRLDDASTTGTVRVEREEWRADAPGFEPLAVGTRVTVMAVEGTHLIVKPVDTEESA